MSETNTKWVNDTITANKIDVTNITRVNWRGHLDLEKEKGPIAFKQGNREYFGEGEIPGYLIANFQLVPKIWPKRKEEGIATEEEKENLIESFDLDPNYLPEPKTNVNGVQEVKLPKWWFIKGGPGPGDTEELQKKMYNIPPISMENVYVYNTKAYTWKYKKYFWIPAPFNKIPGDIYSGFQDVEWEKVKKHFEQINTLTQDTYNKIKSSVLGKQALKDAEEEEERRIEQINKNKEEEKKIGERYKVCKNECNNECNQKKTKEINNLDWSYVRPKKDGGRKKRRKTKRRKRNRKKSTRRRKRRRKRKTKRRKRRSKRRRRK